MDRLQAMTVFVAVAESGGFALAARRLGLSPAAVTRAVAGLERHLGARLLTRTTRRVRLTESGEGFLRDCRRLLGELEAAEAAAAGSHATPRGVLVVTAPTQFGRLHVGPRLPAFLDAHPELALRLQLVDRVVDLVEEGVDVAIRIGGLTTAALVALRLGEVRRVVVGAPAYFDRAGIPGHPRQLADHRLIAATTLMTDDSWVFRDAGRPLPVRIRARLATNAPEVAIEAARQGFGLTRVPIYQVVGELRQGSLVIVLARFEPPSAPVSIVSVEGRRAAAKVRAFVDTLAPPLRALLREG